MSIALTILQQLGGGRFQSMTGARDFAYSDDSLSFRLPRSRGIDRVCIRLSDDATYTMTFFHSNRAPITVYGVSVEQLSATLSEQTGLACAL